MEADESIDVLGSPEQKAYGSVIAAEEDKNKKTRRYRYVTRYPSATIHSFFGWLTRCRNFYFRFILCVLQDLRATEVTCSCKGARAGKSDRGLCPCKAANKDCS